MHFKETEQYPLAISCANFIGYAVGIRKVRNLLSAQVLSLLPTFIHTEECVMREPSYVTKIE